MKHNVLTWAAGLVFFFVTAGVLLPKQPAPMPRYLPGKQLGETTNKWLGPYVHYSWWVVGNQRETTTTWISPAGKVDRKLSGPKVDAHWGFAYDYSQSPIEVYGINADWKLKRSNKPGGYHTATPDSRYYLYEHYPKKGQVAVDVYVMGKLANTVGPYTQYLLGGLQHNDDGSLAVIVWKDEKKKTPQVVVAGPDGKVAFQADTEDPVMFGYGSPIAPGGRGALLQPNRGGDSRHQFDFYTRAGKTRTVKLKYNARCAMWLPGTAKSLFSTALGAAYRFQLIDWETGKTVWDIADPFARRANTSAPAIVATGNLLLFCGREHRDNGPGQDVIRTLYAVDVPSGNVLASWKSDPLRPEDTNEWLLQVGNHIYVMTDHAFAEILPQEILARKNGWQ